ncbi:MAG: n-acetylglutamate synthase [Crocinitomicaceae bacterium]|nr:n-acetylglutamate synthase [Crocinitomicaceae bacterium]
MNYHNRKFRAVSNSENGEITTEMIFHYQQSGNVLTCSYSGGVISSGHLIGIVNDSGEIDMRYHQVNTSGEIMTGICASTPKIMENGKIQLIENWQWTSGDCSKGSSILEEI